MVWNEEVQRKPIAVLTWKDNKNYLETLKNLLKSQNSKYNKAFSLNGSLDPLYYLVHFRAYVEKFWLWKFFDFVFLYFTDAW